MAEAKARFSELIDRVGRGERFVVSRRGKPALAFVLPAELAAGRSGPPSGLLAIVGGLADWEDLPEVTREIHASRRRARDRAVPDMD